MPLSLQSVSQVNGSHLIVEELGSELVIFDRKTNKAHMLDPRAAAIWRASVNGVNVDSLLSLVDAPTEGKRRSLVLLAISDLERAGLMLSDGVSGSAMPRRGLLKSLGTAAAMPLVISLLAPKTAAAQSTCNSSTGGLGGRPGVTLDTGTCGIAGGCSTPDPAGPITTCDSSSSGSLADGCGQCLTGDQCCSNNCFAMVCQP